MRDAQEHLAQVILALAALAAGTALAGPLRVVTTTAELQSLAEAVGGDLVAASHLVPAGRDAESFQPRPSDATALRGAAVVMRVGVDYDLWLDPLLRESENPAVQRGAPGYVDASVDIALLDVRIGGIGGGHPHGRGNPHYWLDPKNAEVITGTLLETLARVDPANAKRYEANRLAFLARLDARIADWSRRLAAPRPLIAYHDTWPYLARRFRLRFVGVIETRPGIAPSPAHLAELVRAAAREHVAAVVREPYEPARDAEFIAARSGAKIAVLVSSVGAVPEASDYISLIDHDVRALEQAMR